MLNLIVNEKTNQLHKEYILCAAIWYKDLPVKEVFAHNILPINCDRGIVFCGHRHTQCLYSMCSITGQRSVEPEVGEFEEGFLTSKNRFVDRVEASQIAIANNQVLYNEKPSKLFSEDLY